MPKNDTYTNCHCPQCKHPLDGVSIQTTACPQCNHALKPEAVWQTRHYTGLTILPWWVGLFGWPLLLILGGAILLIQRYYALDWSLWHGDWGMLLGKILLSLGLIWFIVKYAMKGDE